MDEFTLAALDHAMGACLTFEGTRGEEGPRVVGADMTVPHLLGFLSGYDASHEVELGRGWVEYPDEVYNRDDVIRALIDEVRRLRTLAEQEQEQEHPNRG